MYSRKTGRTFVRSLFMATVVVATFGVARVSSAAVDLSTNSSDPDVAAGSLSAALDFEVRDLASLGITIVNHSAYDIQAIYFNARKNVVGLTLVGGPVGWELEAEAFAGDRTDTGAFGIFDYVVWVKGKKGSLEPGESMVFEIAIQGPGPFSELDFSGEASATGDGETAARVAALFAKGEDEAIGATHAPEPNSFLLTALGLVGVTIAGRKRSRRR